MTKILLNERCGGRSLQDAARSPTSREGHWNTDAVHEYVMGLTDNTDRLDRLTYFGEVEREIVTNVSFSRLLAVYYH